MERRTATRKALRDVFLGWSWITGFLGLALYIYGTSPAFSEPYRSAVMTIFIITWIGCSIGLLHVLKRNLTPAELSARGLRVGRRVFPYDRISLIEWRPQEYLFRIRVSHDRKAVLISKIGIEDEDEFLEMLKERVSQGELSMTEQ
jgi:hypothetical protein